MLVVMQAAATEKQVREVCERIEALGLKAHPMPGALRTAIGITGNKGALDLGALESMPGVVECIPVSKPYKLVSRETKAEDTVVIIATPAGDVLVGGGNIAMVAGPCAVETEDQCFAIAEAWRPSGVKLFRGGAYKPRTSPYSFQGHGEDGLEDFGERAEEIWIWDYYRGCGQRVAGFGGRVRRRDSDWRAEHAEFFAIEAGGAREEAGAFEARDVGYVG